MKVIFLKDCKWLFNPSIAPSVFHKEEVRELSPKEAEMIIRAGYGKKYTDNVLVESSVEEKKQPVPENKMMDSSIQETKKSKRGRPKKINEGD
jgi:ribosomal protein L22